MTLLDLLTPEPAAVAFQVDGQRVVLRQGERGAEQLIVLSLEQLRRLDQAVRTAARPVQPLARHAKRAGAKKSLERAQ